MKLPEHVDKLRDLIQSAFDKHFARLGLGKNKQLDIEKLPEEIRPKRRRFEEMLENHIGETGDYEHARVKLIDELTFTLFNRLAAVKVMEAASLFPPVLTKLPEHGDRSFGHKAWLEINPHMRSEDLEGIREYLKSAFDKLGETLPLYSRDYPYALLPDAISLNEIIDAFNAVEKDPQVGKEIWQSDDVLGWLYESYNNRKKQAHKDSKAKTEYDKVSLQSQVYTPRWVVQFLVENSLGKLYLEMFPDSEIKTCYKIANAPQTQERQPKPLHEIKIIDPACGSGNFLLYAFDFFYELYIDQIENYGADYDEKDIPRLIIENNLHGIDLDDRAIQLAQLGLFIKAKKKRRTIGKLAFNVVSSDFYLPEYKTVEHIFTEGTTLDQSQQELIADIWTDLQFAYKFGSLIRLDEKVKAKLRALEDKQPDLFTAMEIEAHKSFAATFFQNLKTAVEQYAQAQGNTFLTSKTRDAITFLELLTTKYDVATANPPYTNSANFGPELKTFVEDNYKKPYKFHTNLYATFIKVCDNLLGDSGKLAMVHPLTFMYIKTFEGVREYILSKYHINILVEAGMGGVFPQYIFVDPVFYVLEKGKKDYPSLFISLNQYSNTYKQSRKKEFMLQAISDYIAGVENEHNYTIPQEKLKIIKSWPFIYWISDEFREKFGETTIDDISKVLNGVKTGSNERLLRFWWEISADKNLTYTEKNKHWIKYAKGGPFNKWYGNMWLCINYLNNGAEIKKSKNYALISETNSFRLGITYSDATSKGVAFRVLDSDSLFDMSGPGILLNEPEDLNYIIGILNTNLIYYIANCLNSTVHTQIGDIKRIPFVNSTQQREIISSLASTNISIKKSLLRYSLVENVYDCVPFKAKLDHKNSIKIFFNYENHLLTQVLINEGIINEKIFEVYELTENDKAMVLAKEGESIGALPVLAGEGPPATHRRVGTEGPGHPRRHARPGPHDRTGWLSLALISGSSGRRR